MIGITDQMGTGTGETPVFEYRTDFSRNSSPELKPDGFGHLEKLFTLGI